MRIAFVYGPFSIGGRPIDFSRLWDDPRGLTGSELSCIEYARAMAARGHDVALLCCQPGPAQAALLDGVRVLASLDVLRALDGDWTAVCSWNEPDMLRLARPSAVRLLNQQLNDWEYCKPSWKEYVDVATSPSEHHKDHVGKLASLSWDKWKVLPNGCDPTVYGGSSMRTPGRVLWASSPDRGLHLLLDAWPEIKERKSHATLDCYYNFPPSFLEACEDGHVDASGQVIPPHLLEIGRRTRYVRYALPRLAHLGVRHLGSVSRRQISIAMSEATVLAYPCDTVRYTEGFSVTTMEACAAGLVPVISDVDALGSIYGELGEEVVIKSPVASRMDEFVDAVCDHIDGDLAVQERGRALAARHAWPLLAERLETILLEAKEAKR
jgi:glycosyltransferase involved in cell wall biosynthesis